MAQTSTDLAVAIAVAVADQAVMDTMRAAVDLDVVCRRNPELTEDLRSARDRLYALVDAARDVERDIAAVHARRCEGVTD